MLQQKLNLQKFQFINVSSRLMYAKGHSYKVISQWSMKHSFNHVIFEYEITADFFSEGSLSFLHHYGCICTCHSIEKWAPE